jgi:hypothetical protein
LLAVLALGALSLAACSVQTTPNGLIVKTQHKYLGSQVTKTSQGDWSNGATIEILNQNGDVVVQSDATTTKITVTTTPFAFADPDKQSDADQALADVTSLITIDEATQGKFYIHCSEASKQYGSAGVGTTGCDSFTVTIPATDTNNPLGLFQAKSQNGNVTASNLYGQVGKQITVLSENGDVKGTGISGDVQIHTENGDAIGSVSVQQGASIEVSTGNAANGATLALPSDFATDALSMTASSGKVNILGFSDLTPTSTSRGTAGAGARSVTLTNGFGDVTLQSQ